MKESTSKTKPNCLQNGLARILGFYGIDRSSDIINIMMDSKLSQNFKKKMSQQPQIGQKLNFLPKVLFNNQDKHKQLKLLANNHTYEELYLYFQRRQSAYECKKTLREKLQKKQLIKSHEFRKRMWLLISGAKQKNKNSHQYYQKLTNFTQYPDYYSKIIKADVVRTIDLKDTQQYQNGKLKLCVLLENYARRNPYIGYCQGMNFIANYIQLMQFNNEEAFWLFTCLMEDIIPMDYYTNMVGVAVDLKIITVMIKILLPKISHQLQKIKIDISIFMLQWLVCLFTSCLPFYLTKIVWDMLIIDGSSTLLKACIVILQSFQSDIMAAEDFCKYGDIKLIDRNKKFSLLQENQLLSKLLSINIDGEILNIARTIYHFQIKTFKEINEDQQSLKKYNKIERWRDVICSIDWPICLQTLRKNKDQNQQVQFWTIRKSGPPKIIKDYFDLVKNYRPSQQIEQPQKQLLIGRVPHICDKKNYEKRQTMASKEIQMGSYQHQIDQEGKIVWKPNHIQNEDINTLGFSTLDFYHRATHGKLKFFTNNYNIQGS